MRRLSPILLLVPGLVLGEPTDRQGQQVWLLEQIRLGEALNREELVQNSLSRLWLIEPDNVEALAASMRLALRQQNRERASELYAHLQRLAPGSDSERQAYRLLELSRPEGQKALQQVRLMAVAGRNEEALKQYDELFDGEPPSLELALDYWTLRSKLPGQRSVALDALTRLDQQYPGSTGVRQTLVGLLFAERQDKQALAMLRLLAADPNARNDAAQREFDYLKKQPVGRDSAVAWQDFLERYPGTPIYASARRLLDEQEAQLADPAWQAGQLGKRLLQQGRNTQAETQLRRALRGYPDDAGLYGNLGYVLMRQHRYPQANAAFRQAADREQDTYFISKWRDMVDASHYWMLLQQGDQALQSGASGQARALYQQARRQQPGDVFAVLRLANLAQQDNDPSTAESLYLQARRMAPDNEGALRGLLRIYQAQSPEKVVPFLDGLSAREQALFGDLRRSLQLDGLKREAESAQQRQDWPGLSRALEQARQLDPDDPWLAQRLANSLRQQQRLAQADAVFSDLLMRQGNNPAARYAHALYLESTERDASALSSLEVIESGRWDTGMQALAARAQRRLLMARVDALRAAGQEPAAIALLEQEPEQSVADLMLLAGWAQQRGDRDAARGYYHRVLDTQPEHAAARLARIEDWIASGQLNLARQDLEQQAPFFSPDQVSARRRLANAWAAVGQPQRALTQLEWLALEQEQRDPQLYRDLARLQAHNDPQRALDRYALGMRDAGLLDEQQAAPRDDVAFTRASRAKDDDGWLLRSLRADVDELYQRQNPTVTLLQDYGWRDNDATPGTSDLQVATTILQVDLPVGQGQGFLRAERVSMDAGSFETDSDGLHRKDFGTCQFSGRTRAGVAIPAGCQSDSQRADGTTLALGWKDKRLAADIGVSPQGFEVSNILGGVTWNGKLGTLGWSLTGSRRPMTNSLLSYAGAVDPRTGVRWGGVTANGLTLGLSHDQGGAHGVWANFGQHWLRGENVADNQRLTAMTGYYYKLVDRVDERLRSGVSLMYWRYEKNLGDYSLGQGGYYSPQRYVSLGLPASYAWRNADWSVFVEGSVGYSWAQSDDRRLYPLDSLNDKLLTRYDIVESNVTASRAGGSSSGVGYRLQGLMERRLNDHLVLGAGFTWQRSEDYAPSRALLYLRYAFDPWQGNLPLPVQPLIPYGNFR